MKTKVLLCFVISSFILASCNKPPVPTKEEDKNQPQASIYAGEWEYTQILLKNGILSMNGSPVGTFSGTGKNITGFVEITENPDRYIAEVEFTADLAINVFQQNIQQDVPVEKKGSAGDWEESNGKLVLKPDDKSNIEIISSSENKIVFKGNFDQKVNYGQFSFDSNSDVEFTIEK